MRYRSFDEMLEASAGKLLRLVVVDPAGEEVMEALSAAVKIKLVLPVLVGAKGKIEPLVRKFGIADAEFVDADSPEEASLRAVEIVREGKGELLMKGKVSTPILLKAVLDSERGLRKGKLLSHIAVLEISTYPKLTIHTDAGMNINPDILTKVEILKNALEVARKLGTEKPYVAVLSAIETVSKDMPETLDAAMLSKMAERGDFGEAIVDGPLAFDVAVSAEAAKLKGINTPVAGNTDIFLYPNIASGNISVKSLIYLAGARVGGVVVGAKVPVVLLSRADSPKEKLASLALGSILTGSR